METKKVVIVLLIIAIVFSAVSIYMSFGDDGGYGVVKVNQPAPSNVGLYVEPNGINGLVLGVLYG